MRSVVPPEYTDTRSGKEGEPRSGKEGEPRSGKEGEPRSGKVGELRRGRREREREREILEGGRRVRCSKEEAGEPNPILMIQGILVP